MGNRRDGGITVGGGIKRCCVVGSVIAGIKRREKKKVGVYRDQDHEGGVTGSLGGKPFGPSIEGIGLRRAFPAGTRGMPWIARGSFIRVGSSLAGTGCLVRNRRLGMSWAGKLTSADDSAVIPREPRAWGCRRCSTPEMFRRVGEEIASGFAEEAGAATVAFGEDDFVEQFDGRVVRTGGFALVNELVETLGMSANGVNDSGTVITLSLLQHFHVLHVFVRHALHELIHLELVDHPRPLLIARSGNQISSIGVQQAGETPHKRCANLIGPESIGAHDADGVDACFMSICAASCSWLDGARSPAKPSQWRAGSENLPLHRYKPSSDFSSHSEQAALSSCGLHCRQCPSCHLVVSVLRTGCIDRPGMIVDAASVDWA